ncbi:META domain-containing protein [Streptomyces sp. NPDC006997]|uniref:META domain-containing protein n=1 Tax=Streptomyces sp. NPDC006997 TaxID=3155356 RepID=UPI003411141C
MYRQTHRTTATLTLTALALLPLAAACGTEKADGGGSAAASAPLTGVHWTVDSLTVDGTTHEAPASARIRIDDNGRAQGNLGCNHFSARATVDGDSVRLTDAESTEMACEDAPMNFERRLSAALTGDTLSARTDDGHLTLTTSTGDTVRLTQEKDAALYGTRWTVTVTGTGSGEVSQSLPAGTEGKAHLTFDQDTGRVTGSLGCNRVTARATFSDGTVTLGPASTTRRMCDASLMDTEKRLLGLFDGPADYRLDHRTLTLTSPNGDSVTANAGQ